MSWELPPVLHSNAFTGVAAAAGSFVQDPHKWGLNNPPPDRIVTLGLVEAEADWHNWSDPQVGWGVVAAAAPGLSDADLAANKDLPQSVRDLIAERNNAPVFRYRKGWAHQNDQLTNYAADADFEIAGSDFGVNDLPKYLLILGGPDDVPWDLQFQLSSNRFVGRLPLAGAALDNYIAHLRAGWNGSQIEPAHPVVWATDYGFPDITELMRAVVAKPVYDLYAANPKIAATLIDGANATRKNLIDALTGAHRPAIVVTTSHGMIAAEADPKNPQQLGVLVDQNRQLLDPAALLGAWEPDGAMWYAHACCSAGTQGGTGLHNLISTDSDLGKSLAILKQIGPAIAPFPMRLLSAAKPARAFIGHVEPTFDWTLRNSETGQLFTSPIEKTLYNELLQPNSVGYAMHTLLGTLAAVNSRYIKLMNVYQASAEDNARALNYAMRGRDLEAMVLLGDPTAILPVVD